MTKAKKERAIEVMKMVAQDMKDDAARFDGKPFTGKTVAEYMGCQGAAIAAVALTLVSILEDNDDDV